MAKKPVKYYVVDAFTESAFKGNPAAVCLLKEEKDDEWLQALAAEFKITATCHLTRILNNLNGASNPCFRLRWFSPVTEAKLCGHATLAAAHALFSSGLVDTNVIEFVTLSGILTAKRVSNLQKGGAYIELDFPADTITELNFDGTSQISGALKGASIVDIKRTHNVDDLLVEVTSAKNVTEVEPQYDEIVKCPGRGIIVSGIAPPESGFDFYTRFFVPKYGVNEDPVCGSAHCALASYWSKKLGKCDFNAYQVTGDEVPPSTFCRTNVEEWDRFRNIDMDKEVNIIHALEKTLDKKKGPIDADKLAVLNAWHRVDCKTRDAIRRSSLSELIEGYEECVRTFITEKTDGDVLELRIQDPFHRLLLHGVCEFYNLASDTVTDFNSGESSKMTKIKKKKRSSPQLPNMTLSHFLKMSKEGSW